YRHLQTPRLRTHVDERHDTPAEGGIATSGPRRWGALGAARFGQRRCRWNATDSKLGRPATESPDWPSSFSHRQAQAEDNKKCTCGPGKVRERGGTFDEKSANARSSDGEKQAPDRSRCDEREPEDEKSADFHRARGVDELRKERQIEEGY